MCRTHCPVSGENLARYWISEFQKSSEFWEIFKFFIQKILISSNLIHENLANFYKYFLNFTVFLYFSSYLSRFSTWIFGHEGFSIQMLWISIQNSTRNNFLHNIKILLVSDSFGRRQWIHVNILKSLYS